MRQFTHLFDQLDQTTKTNGRLNALVDYLDHATDEDKLWAIALLSGKRPRRLVRSGDLRKWAAEASGVPLWLFEDTYHVVGDLAETIALLVPGEGKGEPASLATWMNRLSQLSSATIEEKKQVIQTAWANFNNQERLVFNKLITGGFRVGVSRKLMGRALSRHTGIPEKVLAHRLMGDWRPDTASYHAIVMAPDMDENASQPYPFYLAHGLDDAPESLGDVANWQVEYKWDGIRGQVIVRRDKLFVWSRGEELVTDKFPEFDEFVSVLPSGTVLDGEIVTYGDKILDFNVLQKRIGRKRITKAILQQSPVKLIAYDLLEYRGMDMREQPLSERRRLLEQLAGQANHPALLLSGTLDPASWEDVKKARKASRQQDAEGVMIKHKGSPYEVGRKRGKWWKWKVDPLVVDAVLVYAMQGHGRRTDLYTDYTFAVWDGKELVTLTKAYSGLTDKEFKAVDRFVRQNTLERFGPVRSVKPELVFEIAFEGIAASSRHKSGVALRFPRMSRWRKDKPVSEAGTKKELINLLHLHNNK